MTIQTIDKVEDGDMSEYSDVNDAGSNVTFQATSSSPIEGTYSATTSSADTGTQRAESSSGLNHYPSQGEVVWISYRHTQNAGNARPSVYFGFTDTDNTYEIKFDAVNGNLDLIKHDGGTSTTLAQDTSFTQSAGTNYDVRVNWGGNLTNTIDVDVTKRSDGTSVGSLSATDSTHTSGGIALEQDSDGGANTQPYFDDSYADTEPAIPDNLSITGDGIRSSTSTGTHPK